MTATTLQQKQLILDLIKVGRNSDQIAEELGLSVRTVRKWGQIGKKRGLHGATQRATSHWGDGEF
jgi:DNA-binding NarL/FixJ family response regulator